MYPTLVPSSLLQPLRVNSVFYLPAEGRVAAGEKRIRAPPSTLKLLWHLASLAQLRPGLCLMCVALGWAEGRWLGPWAGCLPPCLIFRALSPVRLSSQNLSGVFEVIRPRAPGQGGREVSVPQAALTFPTDVPRRPWNHVGTRPEEPPAAGPCQEVPGLWVGGVQLGLSHLDPKTKDTYKE